MRYIYMFCLVLSSLFTYKQIYAETYVTRYAFFIPKNAFQENVISADVREPKASAVSQKLKEKKVSIMPEQHRDVISQNKKETHAVSVKTVTSVEKKNDVQIKKKIAIQQDIKEEGKVPQKKNVKAPVSGKKIIKASVPEKNLQSVENGSFDENKSVKELLATLPYPDFKQPKFKQLYALYALDLRTLYREGNFLANPEQEASLAKANSVQRFNVK